MSLIHKAYNRLVHTGPPIPEEERGPFLRKVFGTVLVCMGFTAAFFVTALMIPDAAELVIPYYKYIGAVGLGLLVVSVVLLVAVKFCRRIPLVFICLGGIVIGICLVFATVFVVLMRTILIAVIVTAVVELGCFVLSFTKMDYTKYWVYAIVSAMSLAGYGLVMVVATLLFNEEFAVVNTVIGALFTLIQSVTIIIIVQMVLKGKIVFGVDQWALVAVLLYFITMVIVLILLRLCSTSGGTDHSDHD